MGRPVVAPPLHVSDPVVIPGVEVEGAHLGDVRAEVAVDPRALEADELSEVDARPCILSHCAATRQAYRLSRRAPVRKGRRDKGGFGWRRRWVLREDAEG